MRNVSSRRSPISSGRSLRGAGALNLASIVHCGVGARLIARCWRTLKLGPEVVDESRASRERMRVLFVEDDPSVAQMYKLKLELDGYEVEVASDGEKALEMARKGAPDMIF